MWNLFVGIAVFWFVFLLLQLVQKYQSFSILMWHKSLGLDWFNVVHCILHHAKQFSCNWCSVIIRKYLFLLMVSFGVRMCCHVDYYRVSSTFWISIKHCYWFLVIYCHDCVTNNAPFVLPIISSHWIMFVTLKFMLFVVQHSWGMNTEHITRTLEAFS